SEENERRALVIETPYGVSIAVVQIAGLIARRIVTYSKLGETVKQGDRMGIIRFGSRVDVFVPVGSADRAKVGDITVAGVTILAEIPR
ncbi:MAG TPA: phosphatidylserine decarboxylase, partial [Gemmatimonadaceae bacterium]|nr:phosphatidylserine decarboxylase [Gemmatimonadaceae bacterium]